MPNIYQHTMGPPSVSNTKWVVRWDDQEHFFDEFFRAKVFLLKELWWLAEDLQDESTMDAWDQVLKWENVLGAQYSVLAGKPPARYTLSSRHWA